MVAQLVGRTVAADGALRPIPDAPGSLPGLFAKSAPTGRCWVLQSKAPKAAGDRSVDVSERVELGRLGEDSPRSPCPGRIRLLWSGLGCRGGCAGACRRRGWWLRGGGGDGLPALFYGHVALASFGGLRVTHGHRSRWWMRWWRRLRGRWEGRLAGGRQARQAARASRRPGRSRLRPVRPWST